MCSSDASVSLVRLSSSVPSMLLALNLSTNPSRPSSTSHDDTSVSDQSLTSSVNRPAEVFPKKKKIKNGGQALTAGASIFKETYLYKNISEPCRVLIILIRGHSKGAALVTVNALMMLEIKKREQRSLHSLSCATFLSCKRGFVSRLTTRGNVLLPTSA